jgi:hypothetical protein
MPRPVAAVVAAALAALVTFGVVAMRHTPSRATVSSQSTDATTAAPDRGAAAGGDVASVVPAIEAFVERERGLKFLSPVKVTALADKAFEARATALDPKEVADVHHDQEILRAMGLLAHGVDLEAVERRLTAGSVLGFYDPKTKELVVRGEKPTPYVRSVLAHELTHALDDQHFGLDRDELGDEASAGFHALGEGNAVRIEELYRASLSPADRVLATREERVRGLKVPRVPGVVEVLFSFPYDLGPDLVAAILRSGGQARLDAAFRDPPASTEQVIDPARYLGGDAPKAVATPPADGPALDDGEIGELLLVMMLRSGVGDARATAAADGWAGDHYVAWREGTRTCVRMNFVMDTPADEAELRTALAAWAAKRSGRATATGTSLRTCG